MPRPLRKRVSAGRLFVLVVAPLVASPVSAQDHPVWGRLEPGPHPVGFRVEYSRDPARPEWTAEQAGRLMQVATWYPARSAAGEPVTIREYIDLQESGLLEDDRRAEGILTEGQREHLANEWATWGIMTGVDRARWNALLDTPMRAVLGAAPAEGRFPVLLMLQGASGSVADQMGTAEYLASHGYVVVTVPSRGLDYLTTRVWGDHRLTEGMIADADYALRAIARDSFADLRRLGVHGFSRGGMVALLVAMRNPAVDAVVGFDPSLAAIIRSPWFEGARLRVPFLFYQAGARTPPAVLDSMRYVDTRIVSAPGLHHVDLGALGMMHTALGVRNQYIVDSDERIRATLEWIHRQELAFLDAHVKGDADAAARFEQALDNAPEFVRVSHRPARPAPPLSNELAEMVWRRGGIAQAAALIRAARASDPAWRPFPEVFLNATGYRFVELGRDAEALGAARLNVELFPESANAHDTLGEMLARAGQRDAAIRAYERSVALDPENANARERIEQLRSGSDAAE